MKLPLSWLKEFVAVTGSVERLAERLTMAGVEVEDILDRGRDFSRVVVGEVLAVDPHPNADKLRLASVRVRVGGSPQAIVCGAPNIAVGQKVAVAMIGAKLPNGLIIAKRSIRGVESNAMICAEDELGLGTNHAGILVLDPATPVGRSFGAAMGYDDIVLDLAIPGNRPDLLSVRGLAWEISAITGSFFRAGKSSPVRPTGQGRSVAVRVEDRSDCPLYTASVIRGITVRPSPDWIQRRLRASGMRPINGVVDATNLMMLEYGQPMHAFDAKKVSGGLVVRRAKAGERLRTIDRQNRILKSDMLVIADATGPIALAGVMGGASTEVNETTTDVLLESAIFHPGSVRRTSRRLGLVSEASKRFEKGLPFSLPVRAGLATVKAIIDSGGGRAAPGMTIVGKKTDPSVTVSIGPTSFARLLGMPVSMIKAKSVLRRLGFIVRGTATAWRVSVPWWRLDVRIPADLVDEVGRMVGYGALPNSWPASSASPMSVPELVRVKDELRDLLVSLGFTETISHAFYGQRSKDDVGGPHVRVANPLDANQHFLRRSLVPQLRAILERAVDAGNDAMVFEIGRVFLGAGQPIEDQQPWKLAIGLAVKPSKGYVFGWQIRGFAASLLEGLGVDRGRTPDVGAIELKGRVIEWCEFDVADLRRRRQPKRYRPQSDQPAVRRDLAYWVPADRPYGEFSAAVTKAGSPLLETVEVFDVYEAEKRRSYAVHLTFRAPDRTLTEAEISARMRAITDALRQLGAELR